MGDKQKLSELLVEMLHFCPTGQDNSDVFTSLFLNKLPREPRVLLTEVDMQVRQTLGTRTDMLAAHHQRLAHDAGTEVATVSLEEPVVAAIKPSGGNGQQGGEADSMVERASGGRRRRLVAVAVVGADSKLPTLCLTLSRPGWEQAFATISSAMAPRPGVAMPSATGRKTSRPGSYQHRRCWAVYPNIGSKH
jgi:hypothetical protein